MLKKTISNLFTKFLEKKKVSVSIIANEFEISYSSVFNMLKKLKELGWINYEPYKSIYLTRKGEKFLVKLFPNIDLQKSFFFG